MSDLEKFIIENREHLSDDDPGPGHFDRFSEKLQATSAPTRRIRFRHLLQIAASLAIILASGVVIIKSNQGSGKTAAVEIPAEYRDAYDYYVMQVNSKYEKIEDYTFNDAEQKAMLMQELSEMDQYYKDLLKELDAQPGDERAINALIHYYQMKLSVMDQIIEQLNQVKQYKSIENESTDI